MLPEQVRGESLSGDRVPENATRYTIPLVAGNGGRPRGATIPNGRILGTRTEPPQLPIPGRLARNKQGITHQPTIGDRGRAAAPLYWRGVQVVMLIPGPATCPGIAPDGV
jgi:hypothetical protein